MAYRGLYMMDIPLSQFWGKTPKQGESPERYHPAIHHMLDVACVAEALLRDGPPRLRQALFHAWQGSDADQLICWLPFLIASHDLGKISSAFQGQVQQQRDRLSKLGIVFPKANGPNLYHAEISAVWLHDYLDKREPGINRLLMWTLRDAIGGHHGRFTHDAMTEIRRRLHATERGNAQWLTWRDSAYTLLRDLLA